MTEWFQANDDAVGRFPEGLRGQAGSLTGSSPGPQGVHRWQGSSLRLVRYVVPSIATRRVALIAGDSATSASLRLTLAFLRARSAEADVLSMGGCTPAEVAHSSCDAVLVLPAVYPDSTPTRRVAAFVRAAFQEGKVIGARGAGVALLEWAGLGCAVDLTTDGDDVAVDQGVVIAPAGGDDDLFLEAFAAALAASRRWNRVPHSMLG